MSHEGDRARVLIVGGGFGGIEAALALRDMAGGAIEVVLCSPRSDFLYRPFATGEPFGAAEIRRYDLEELARRIGVSLHPDGVASIDREARHALTNEGEQLAYDYLILATGANDIWAVPGAATFWGGGGRTLDGVIAKLRAGLLSSLAFTAPSGCSWTLPLYELALFAARLLESAGIRGVRLKIATPEERPLQVFGVRLAEEVGELLAQRDIEVISGVHPLGVGGGVLNVVPRGEIEANAVVAMPRQEGRAVEGVDHDSKGFVPIDEHCRVVGAERLFAVGDVSAFPVKQGGIATQQADTAAASIAAEVGAEIDPAPFDPVLRAVLWTGKSPRYLHARIKEGTGEAPFLSEEPNAKLSEAKVFGRYLTPFLAGLGR